MYKRQVLGVVVVVVTVVVVVVAFSLSPAEVWYDVSERLVG